MRGVWAGTEPSLDAGRGQAAGICGVLSLKAMTVTRESEAERSQH